MERHEVFLGTGHEDDALPLTAAVSGGLIGATAGIIGGVGGVALAAIAGAVFGALGGVVLERQRKRLEIDEDEGASAEALIEAPRADGGAWETRQHPRPHLHYAYPKSFAVGSMFIDP
ncbi:MAG: hypothetical protein KF764_21650 [Labilithrix sp.]|nr:hypothetical protein [Labilithrix sp.]